MDLEIDNQKFFQVLSFIFSGLIFTIRSISFFVDIKDIFTKEKQYKKNFWKNKNKKC